MADLQEPAKFSNEELDVAIKKDAIVYAAYMQGRLDGLAEARQAKAEKKDQRKKNVNTLLAWGLIWLPLTVGFYFSGKIPILFIVLLLSNFLFTGWLAIKTQEALDSTKYSFGVVIVGLFFLFFGAGVFTVNDGYRRLIKYVDTRVLNININDSTTTQHDTITIVKHDTLFMSPPKKPRNKSFEKAG
jgi:hypothetical protein